MKTKVLIVAIVTIVVVLACAYYSVDIYSWCTSLGDKLISGGESEDYVDYYDGYFNNTSVCSKIFWIGVGIAFVLALLFYFVICNFVFKLAKRWAWLCVLALVFIATFFVTIPQIVGYDADDSDNSTGIFLKAYQIEGEKLDGIGDDESMREEIMQTASDFREQFLAKEDDETIMRDNLPVEMALVNAAYAIILFIVLSFIFKRYTTHGTAIPF